jgi:hypothetical protein
MAQHGGGSYPFGCRQTSATGLRRDSLHVKREGCGDVRGVGVCFLVRGGVGRQWVEVREVECVVGGCR